jgi:hypothetical protein
MFTKCFLTCNKRPCCFTKKTWTEFHFLRNLLIQINTPLLFAHILIQEQTAKLLHNDETNSKAIA